jgi:pimeloyl-ACP methyl ester carboxylesterase
MRDFRGDGPRTAGPGVVWAGPEQGPALVVIDPSGAAIHEDLPATWQPLAEHYQIAWCRVPATAHTIDDIEDALESFAARQSRVDIVAGGLVCEAAVAVADQYREVVRSVLLVDPGPISPAPDVNVQVIAHSHGGTDDRVAPPLPLGHPAVVEALTRTLAAIS